METRARRRGSDNSVPRNQPIDHACPLFATPHFAWRPVRDETGRLRWLRWMFRVEAPAGLKPYYQDRPVAFATAIPLCEPQPWARYKRYWRNVQSDWKGKYMTYLVLWLAMVAIVTQFVGWLFGRPDAFGGATVAGHVVYLPGQFLTWSPLVADRHAWIIDAAAAACLVLAAVVAGAATRSLYRPRVPSNENLPRRRRAGPTS